MLQVRVGGLLGSDLATPAAIDALAAMRERLLELHQEWPVDGPLELPDADPEEIALLRARIFGD